jgi:hypothetical protein
MSQNHNECQVRGFELVWQVSLAVIIQDLFISYDVRH